MNTTPPITEPTITPTWLLEAWRLMGLGVEDGEGDGVGTNVTTDAALRRVMLRPVSLLIRVVV
jgi:hypothetical protein